MTENCIHHEASEIILSPRLDQKLLIVGEAQNLRHRGVIKDDSIYHYCSFLIY